MRDTSTDIGHMSNNGHIKGEFEDIMSISQISSTEWSGHSHFWIDLEEMNKLYHSHGSSFYLRIGTLCKSIFNKIKCRFKSENSVEETF